MLAQLGLMVLAVVARSGSDDVGGEVVASVGYAFEEADELGDWSREATGDAGRRMPTPKAEGGRLVLLESWSRSSAAVAPPPPVGEPTRVVELSWSLILSKGTEGMGVVWADVEAHGSDGLPAGFEDWEAPSLARAFGVGFDASNPVNRDPFRGSGNLYDRPQHEVSLHWDGMEVHKRTTPVDFRDEAPHAVRLRLEFVPGGAEVSLWLDHAPVYERFFLATMTAFVGRPLLGARNGETAGDVALDDLAIECRDPIERPRPPLEIMAIDRALNDAAHARHEAQVEFPEETSDFARILCTIRLEEPPGGFDPWDRTATVCIFDDEGERFELVRYITPYHKGHEWTLDVTDFRPLLCGPRRVVQSCGTQGQGWLVTVLFSFHHGRTDRLAWQVVNLWSGSPEIGNPDHPVAEFYSPRVVPLDVWTAFARVRMVVSGHGMAPNTGNAGEFMPLGRTLTVNDESFRSVLWKTDNYLNPCRPQGGTWKYDRAGWAPGDVVRPWEVDVSHLVEEGRDLRIEYRLDPYLNEARGETWAPTHLTEAQLILYESAEVP